MKKILIATYDFFPEPSANSICINHIINHIKSNCEIHLVCPKHVKEKCPDYEFSDGIHIHRIKLLENTMTRKIFGLSNSFFSRLLKTILYRIYNTFSMYKSIGYVRCYQSRHMQRALKNIINDYKIDTMFSVSAPFSTHVACSKIKSKYNLKWIAYELDPFSLNFLLDPKKFKKRKKLEMKVFENADMIVSSFGIDEYNKSQNFRDEYRGKTISVALPGLIKKDLSKSTEKSILKIDKDAINLVYSGSFYTDLRTPEPLFEILKDNPESKKIKFHIIGGTTTDAQRKNIDEEIVIEYPRIPPEKCDMSIIDADIAINFDNNIPNQMPSKILNYMALGMPVVNFYHKNCTLGEACLEKYEPHLSICVDDASKDVSKKAFFKFLEENTRVNPNKKPEGNIDEKFINDFVCKKISEVILSN